MSLPPRSSPDPLNPEPTPRSQLSPGWAGVGIALMGFAAGLVISSITATVAEALTGYHAASGSPLPVAVTVADLIGLWTGLVGAAMWFSRKRGTGRLADDFGWRIGAWWDLPLGASVGLACQYGLVTVLYLPLEQIDPGLRHRLSQPTSQDTGAAHTLGPVIALVVFLAIAAPLVEELFFRGLLLRSLARVVPAPAAVVLSGLLFGLAHFEPLQFLGLAAVGMVFAALAWYTGRLGPSIGAHMAFNAAAVLTAVHLH